MKNSIGIAISTYKRPEAFKKTYAEISYYLSEGAKLVVVSDYDENPPAEADYVFDSPAGIARVKNKCLELLQDCDHIFLFDNDCYPIAKDWHIPYMLSKEPHLMYIIVSDKTKEIYRDNYVVAYNHVNGCMLYFKKIVLEIVGGFDTDYKMYEHTDLTNRIYNAGLTSFRVMDIPNSKYLFHSMDEHLEVDTSLEGKTSLIPRNRQLKMSNKKSKAYIEFRSNK